MERAEIEMFERNRLAELLSRLYDQGKSTKGERGKLWEIEDRSQLYTVLDRLDILSDGIVGYVSQITTKGYTRQKPQDVINHLDRLTIFNVECIMKWYPTAEQEYPKIKQYFELLDYVRLLTIDYIQRYQLQEVSTK